MIEHNVKKINNTFTKDTFGKTTEDRRKKVLEVALDEFATKGYNATSINDIARKANISIGSIYSYFASKEDLFLSIVNNAYHLMETILNEVVENSSDIFDCIKRMLIASREFALEHPQLNQIYLDITTQGLSHLAIRLSDTIEIITPRLLSNKIIEAKKEGLIRDEMDERVVAYCIDNIFVIYQFSFSSDYYRERLKIFIGEDNINNIEEVEKGILMFIRSAIEMRS